MILQWRQFHLEISSCCGRVAVGFPGFYLSVFDRSPSRTRRVLESGIRIAVAGREREWLMREVYCDHRGPFQMRDETI